jgi:hypothetical protein
MAILQNYFSELQSQYGALVTKRDITPVQFCRLPSAIWDKQCLIFATSVAASLLPSATAENLRIALYAPALAF